MIGNHKQKKMKNRENVGGRIKCRKIVDEEEEEKIKGKERKDGDVKERKNESDAKLMKKK